MPPKVRRPAAVILPRLRAKAKARGHPAGPIPVRRKPAAAVPPQETDPSEVWILVKDLTPEHLKIGQKIIAKVWYAGEEVLIQGVVRENTTDAEGQWIGIMVTGTPIHQLRTFLITSPRSDPILYLSRLEHPPGARLSTPGIGYLLAYREVLAADHMPWAENCRDQREGVDENEDLREAAQKMGLQGPRGAPGQLGIGQEPSVEEARKPPGEKKLKGKQKVKKMLEAAKWNCVGTPLDPQFRKPIKIRVKKKGSSSSSRSSGDATSSLSSHEGLGSEHRLRTLAKRLPGYLCRSSAKEAKRNLAEACGESPQSFKIFHRYFRQVVAPRGGSRGLQREMMTLSMILDTLIEGDILAVLDIAAQRLKSLELIQQGADPNLALQLELLPRDHLGMVADDEARYAQRQFTAEAKLQRQLKSAPATGKGTWTPYPKEPPPLSYKGKRKGAEKGKGKDKAGKPSAEVSKVTPPQN